jgi:hypothetical protein
MACTELRVKTEGTTRVSERSERLPAVEYTRDDRAALPRRGWGIDYVAVRAGAPEPYRSQLGKNIFSSAFPYPQWLETSGRLSWKEYRFIDLENDRWRVTVCPDLAGRILSLYDKSLQREALWQPAAFRFASVGLPGAWLLGGIEFNAFRFGHCVHGMMPVRTDRVTHADDSVGLRWGAVDELLESEWSVELCLRGERVEVHVTLRNHSQAPQPGYWWTNIAAPMRHGTRLLFKPGPTIHHGWDYGMSHDTWPMLEGRDWQFWQNHDRIMAAYVADYGSDVFGYAPPGEGWALAHSADRRVCRGRKLWSVGAGHDSDVWMDRLGEAALPSYCEIQSGRLPTQLESDLLEPGACLTWTEAFSTIPWREETADPAAAFASFERAAQPKFAGMDTQEIRASETLVEDAPRAAVSRAIVLDPAALDAPTVQATVEAGWVGGEAWVRKLRQSLTDGSAGPWHCLALGAALSDLAEPAAAADLLVPLASAGGARGGYAAWLLGWQAEQAGRREEAIALYREAAERLPDRLPVLCSAQRLLVESGAASEVEQIWAGLPAESRGSDAARLARAQIAFLRGFWADVRAELTAPLPGIAEGGPGPWLLHREASLAEALEHARAGDVERALDLLRDACGFMPQFGVGRLESSANADLVFYRWLLATRAGRRQYAAALAAHLLRLKPPDGSADAAYLLRLARELADPSAAERERAAKAWSEDAGPGWEPWVPLRHAVLAKAIDGSDEGWAALRDHWLYRYRARFEMTEGARN